MSKKRDHDTHPSPTDTEGASAPEVDTTNFDPARFRLDPDMNLLDIARAVLEVRVGRPSPQEFIRVHPDPAYRLPTAVLDMEREFFLIDPSLQAALMNEWHLVVLYTTINRAGVLRLWPVKLPKPGFKPNSWHTTAHAAAKEAMGAWARIVTSPSCYEAVLAAGPIPDPDWPKKSFSELLAIAFKDKVVDSLDHPVVRQLRGNV